MQAVPIQDRGQLNQPRQLAVDESILVDHKEGQEVKILGIGWQPGSDTIVYNRFHNLSTPSQVTKRQIASQVAQASFDPLGLSLAVTIRGRLLVQECFRQNLDWDQPVSNDIKSEYTNWIKELEKLHTVSFP